MKMDQKDVFDINGYFSEHSTTKISLNGIDKVSMGQYKPNVLRIALDNSRNSKISYSVGKKQIKIDIGNNAIKTIPYSINSIDTQENNIIVKFNNEVTKNDISINSFKNKNNFEYIFDINGTFNPNNAQGLNIDGIDDIIATQNKTNSVRLRIVNKTPPKVKSTLNKKELIISLDVPKDSTNSKSINAQTTTPSKTINKTVVIDAGHGGDDVGAVGPNKEYEKVINLNVARYLYAVLKQRGYKVFITRSDDHFIPVKDRTVLANEKSADIFISIHTNSVPKEKANEITGIETFFLSPARSERAKRVAALENKSEVEDMNSSTKDSFLESLNRPRITASHKLAIDVQAGLLQSAKTKFSDINDSGVREGPFWVLVGAQMPSILVELGYVSHPKESKRLYSKDYQQTLANGLANGIDSYFSKNP